MIIVKKIILQKKSSTNQKVKPKLGILYSGICCVGLLLVCDACDCRKIPVQANDRQQNYQYHQRQPRPPSSVPASSVRQVHKMRNPPIPKMSTFPQISTFLIISTPFLASRKCAYYEWAQYLLCKFYRTET